jgi:hypothetical protein
MFSSAAKVMGEAMGVADNCSCFFRANARSQFTYAPFLLPDETAYLLFKSSKAEYCFTDNAVVISFGEAAAGKKRTVLRFDYAEDIVDNVTFETAGMSVTDQDCEIKFKIGVQPVSIDIKKAETDQAIMAYRVIVELSRVQGRCRKKLRIATENLQKGLPPNLDASTGAHQIQLVHSLIETLNPMSYKDVFERLTPP